MLRVRGAITRGRVSFGAGLLSQGAEVKRAVPSASERNAKHGYDKTSSPTDAPQLLRNSRTKSSNRSNSRLNRRNGKLFHSGNVPHPTLVSIGTMDTILCQQLGE